MEIHVLETAQQTALLLKGRFDLHQQQQMRGVIEDLVADGKSTLTLDLSGVSYIDSAAIGLLLLAKDTCTNAGGSIILSRPQEMVDRVLKLCRLDDMFRIERGKNGAAPGTQGAEKRKVLILDGSEDKRFVLSSLLTRHKFQVTEAEDGERGLRLITQEHPDLVLLDVSLPGGLDGFEVARQLNANPQTSDIAILFLTAPHLVRLDVDGLTLQETDFVSWPAEPSEVVGRVKTRLAPPGDELSAKGSVAVPRHAVSTAEQREKETQAELERARLMQARFFPETFPLDRGLEFAGRHRASQKIGGDLFDVQKSGDDHLAFMIADVSGHGVAAALLTGITKVLFQNAVQQCEDPGILLETLNEGLLPYCSSGEYLTMFVGIWDPKVRTLLYSGAGHPPAYVISADGSRMARLEGKGGVLGVASEARFNTMDIQLKPKQRLVLYTDGITEQSNPRYELFGEQRLVELCAQWATLPLDAIVELIYSEVDKFAVGEPQTDDQALLLVEVSSS